MIIVIIIGQNTNALDQAKGASEYEGFIHGWKASLSSYSCRGRQMFLIKIIPWASPLAEGLKGRHFSRILILTQSNTVGIAAPFRRVHSSTVRPLAGYK